MRAVLLPLMLVLAPQTALATLQLGLPVLAPAFVAAAGLSPEAVGLVGGCIGLGSVWLFAANAAVTPVFGPVRALAIACAVASCAALAVTSGSVTAMFVSAVIVGFAYAVTAPAGSQILSDHTPRKWWGTLFSIRQAGVPLGGAIAGVAGTLVAAAAGWEWALVTLAAVPLAVALLLALAPDRFRPPTGRRFQVGPIFSPANLVRPFRTLSEQPALLPVTLMSLGLSGTQGSLFAFLTTFLTDGLGLGLTLAGALYSVMQMVSFAGRIGAGLLADRLGSARRLLQVMALTASATCLVFALLEPGVPVWALFALSAATGITVATWNGLYLAEIARLVPAEEVGSATASVTFFTFIAYMSGPPLFGAVAYLAGYPAAFVCLAAAGLASFAALSRTGTAPSRH